MHHTCVAVCAWNGGTSFFEDVFLVEFMYPVFIAHQVELS